MKIFINENPVDVPHKTSVIDAVRAWDSLVADSVIEGGYLTDGVGRRLPADTLATPGMIVRAVASSQAKEPED